MNTLSKLAVLSLLAAACGGSVQRDSLHRNEVNDDAKAQCAMSLAHPSAAAIQRAVQAASDGSLDVCQGALTRRELYVAELASIDETPDGFAKLTFWMRLAHPGEQPVLRF